jgi:hypothetical protein
MSRQSRDVTLQTCRDLRDTFCVIPLIKGGVFDDEE